MLWATCQDGSAELFIAAASRVFFFSGGVLQLGYVKPQGLGCVRNAGTCCASLLAPDFLYTSICTLDTDAYL